MPFTTPPAFVDGDPASAAELNALGDDLVYLNGLSQGLSFTGCKAKKATQSIASGSETAISFDTEAWDVGGWHSTGTDVIVPAGAIPSGFTTIAVLVIGHIRWASNGTGGRMTEVSVDGTVQSAASTTGLSGDTTDQLVVDLLQVTAGQVITLSGRQTSGGALAAQTCSLVVSRYAAVS